MDKVLSLMSHLIPILYSAFPYLILLLFGRFYTDQGANANLLLAILGGTFVNQFGINSHCFFDLKQLLLSYMDVASNFFSKSTKTKISIPLPATNLKLNPEQFVFTSKTGYSANLPRTTMKPMKITVEHPKNARPADLLKNILSSFSLKSLYNMLSTSVAIFILSMIDGSNMKQILTSTIDLFSGTVDIPGTGGQKTQMICSLADLAGKSVTGVPSLPNVNDTMVCKLVSTAADAIGQFVVHGKITTAYANNSAGYGTKPLVFLNDTSTWIDAMFTYTAGHTYSLIVGPLIGAVSLLKNIIIRCFLTAVDVFAAVFSSFESFFGTCILMVIFSIVYFLYKRSQLRPRQP
jgi:hypothetical protein